MSERQLSDGDVDAIADKLMEKLFERAQREAGKGLFAYLQKILVGAFIAFVAYGAAKYGAP